MISIAVLILELVVIFGVLPRLIFPLAHIPGNALDRIVAGAVAFTALNIAAMYVLGSFGMLETFALIGVWIVTWWVLKGRHQRKAVLAGCAKETLALLDMRERVGAGAAIGSVVSRVTSAGRSKVQGAIGSFETAQPSIGGLITAFSMFVMLIWIGGRRFDHALNQINLVPQDSYLALSWTSFLGNGKLLADGVYPQGTYMWMSVLDRFYPGDTYTYVRYVSPMMGMLELLAIYWVVSRVTRSRAGGVVAMSTYGLFAGHPTTLVVWERQIGSMTQEFALAFVLISLVYGANFLQSKRDSDLYLAGCALFVGLGSNTLSTGYAAGGFAVVVGLGLLLRKFDIRSFRRLVGVGVTALLGANIFFALGWLWNIQLARSFDLYDPTNDANFEVNTAGRVDELGQLIGGNIFFQLGLLGGIVSIIIGLGLMMRKRDHGFALLTMGVSTTGFLVIYDYWLVTLGELFRVRQGWIAAEIAVVALGLGVGSFVAAVAEVISAGDLLARARGAAAQMRMSALELAALGVAVIVVAPLVPTYSAFARQADPSGYPQATEVSLDIVRESATNSFTVVGGPEQFQEVISNGFFVEAWVFAKDIVLSDAVNPGYQIPIPTHQVYVFVEKIPFVGPQARPFGPTQEYYRDVTKRSRIMGRIQTFMEAYDRTHDDAEIIYEDEALKVYKIDRKVDVETADRSPAFGADSYRWLPGQFFDDDGDITADRVLPDPAASFCAGAGALPSELQPGCRDGQPTGATGVI